MSGFDDLVNRAKAAGIRGVRSAVDAAKTAPRVPGFPTPGFSGAGPPPQEPRKKPPRLVQSDPPWRVIYDGQGRADPLSLFPVFVSYEAGTLLEPVAEKDPRAHSELVRSYAERTISTLGRVTMEMPKTAVELLRDLMKTPRSRKLKNMSWVSETKQWRAYAMGRLTYALKHPPEPRENFVTVWLD